MTKIIYGIYNHPDYFSLRDFPGEVWKHVTGAYPQYFASSYGRVKSLEFYKRHRHGATRIPEKILTVFKNKYLNSKTYCDTGKIYTTSIHRAVCIAFHGLPLLYSIRFPLATHHPRTVFCPQAQIRLRRNNPCLRIIKESLSIVGWTFSCCLSDTYELFPVRRCTTNKFSITLQYEQGKKLDRKN